MTESFSASVARILTAKAPEDIFGRVEGGSAQQLRHVKVMYRRLSQIVHPDHNGGMGEEAFRKLNDNYDKATRMIAAGRYGARANFVTVTTKRDTYEVEYPVAHGEIATIYRATSKRSAVPILLKVADHPRDNDLIKREAVAIRKLRKSMLAKFHWFVPNVYETIGVRQSGGVTRQANVMESFDGWVSIEDIAARYPNGIDPRDMAWMWRRLLFILGAAHRAGIVHGAVTPDHVMIHPEMHGLILADWCYAVNIGEPAVVASRKYRSLIAPETLAKKPQQPEADLYSAALTMSSVTRNMPRPLRAHFSAYKLAAAYRPSDAWEMQATFETLLEALYGRAKFRPFSMV